MSIVDRSLLVVVPMVVVLSCYQVISIDLLFVVGATCPLGHPVAHIIVRFISKFEQGIY